MHPSFTGGSHIKRKNSYCMKKVIVFTGGGTAGHVVPGISVLRTLESRWAGSFAWIGSKKGIEKEIVTREGIPYFAIPSGKLRRYFSLLNCIDVARIGLGLVKAFLLLFALKPSAVFSKGGYVSVPVVCAARLLGIYTATHESDLDPGLATKINSRFAAVVFVSYEQTLEYFPEAIRNKVVVTGNPVRITMEHGDSDRAKQILGITGNFDRTSDINENDIGKREDEKPVVLVLGGSLGASQINELVALSRRDLFPECFIIHQMGRKNYKPVSTAGYRTFDFIDDDLCHFFALADIVVSRAGANTLWEIGRTGKAALLIPLSGPATRGDQIRNARFFADNGAALVLTDEEATPDQFTEQIKTLLHDKERRITLGRAAFDLCKKDANATISRLLFEQVTQRR